MFVVVLVCVFMCVVDYTHQLAFLNIQFGVSVIIRPLQ